MNETLVLRNVWFRYQEGENYVLKCVSLNLTEGEILLVLGGNGAGKTTLVLVAGALLPPTRGEVALYGEVTNPDDVTLRKKVGVAMQNPDDQLFSPTVRDELSYSLKQLGLKPSEINHKVQKTAEDFGFLQYLGKPPTSLSFGYRKMVSIAASTIHDPEIILLDEPFLGLSTQLFCRLMKVIKKWRNAKKTVLITSSSLPWILEMVTRVALMNDGRIVTEDIDVWSNAELLAKSGIMIPLFFTPVQNKRHVIEKDALLQQNLVCGEK